MVFIEFVVNILSLFIAVRVGVQIIEEADFKDDCFTSNATKLSLKAGFNRFVGNINGSDHE